jgi:hypothetical protein
VTPPPGRVFVSGRCRRSHGAWFTVARLPQDLKPDQMPLYCSDTCRRNRIREGPRQRAAAARAEQAEAHRLRVQQRQRAWAWAAERAGLRCPDCGKQMHVTPEQVDAAVKAAFGRYGTRQEPYRCPTGYGLHLRTLTATGRRRNAHDETLRRRRLRKAKKERTT